MSTTLINELDTRTRFVLDYLRNLGYQHVEREVEVSIGSRVLQADLVVYDDADPSKPFAVVEVKAGSGEEFHLLHPAVQTAFSLATALGDQVGYLLVSDGSKHQWFKRDSEQQSLLPIDFPPIPKRTSSGPFHLPLMPVISRDQFLNIAQTVTQILRKESSVFHLRLAIDLNRIFIAKIFDEERATSGATIEFKVTGDKGQASERIKKLYIEAIESLGGRISEEVHWSVSESALHKAALLIEPYYFTSISQTVRDTLFWEIFPSFLPRDVASHTTPKLIASLIVRLARPTPADHLIDPACGTGLLLIESLHYLISEAEAHQIPACLGTNLLGVEINAEAVTLAKTNLMLAKISPDQVRLANSLSLSSLAESGIFEGRFDLVVTNPPIGRLHHLIDSPDLTLTGSQSSPLEALFIERSLQLLKTDGRLVVLVPDTLLSSPLYLNVRRWILHNSDLRVIIGLASDFVSPLGYSGRASILLIRNRPPQKSSSVIFADLGSYDQLSSNKPDELHFARQVDAIVNLADNHNLDATGELEGTWTILHKQLNPRRLDAPFWRTERTEQHGKYARSVHPMLRLKDIADIISGRNFRNHLPPDATAAAVLIQAGAVREFHLEIENSPRISIKDYASVARAQIRSGDVLVTTTGQYLGRAAVAESLSIPATVSGAVTILRPQPSLDPNYLVALINSPICRDQIEALQASSTAQPYIRRADLGEISVPLPPLDKQREVAQIVIRLSQRARRLAQKSRELQEQARQAVLDVLETEDRE